MGALPGTYPSSIQKKKGEKAAEEQRKERKKEGADGKNKRGAEQLSMVLVLLALLQPPSPPMWQMLFRACCCAAGLWLNVSCRPLALWPLLAASSSTTNRLCHIAFCIEVLWMMVWWWFLTLEIILTVEQQQPTTVTCDLASGEMQEFSLGRVWPSTFLINSRWKHCSCTRAFWYHLATDVWCFSILMISWWFVMTTSWTTPCWRPWTSSTEWVLRCSEALVTVWRFWRGEWSWFPMRKCLSFLTQSILKDCLRL